MRRRLVRIGSGSGCSERWGGGVVPGFSDTFSLDMVASRGTVDLGEKTLMMCVSLVKNLSLSIYLTENTTKS